MVLRSSPCLPLAGRWCAGGQRRAGRGRPVPLPPGGPVRRAGRHRLLLGPQGAARAAVPARTARAALGGVRVGKTHASAPDNRYYAAVKDRQGGKRAAMSETRKILRQACYILAELGDDALAAT